MLSCVPAAGLTFKYYSVATFLNRGLQTKFILPLTPFQTCKLKSFGVFFIFASVAVNVRTPPSMYFLLFININIHMLKISFFKMME